MPVKVTNFSFDREPSKKPEGKPKVRRARAPEGLIKTPQARLLHALVPEDPNASLIRWPLLNRAMLSVKAGYSVISGSVTRALDGLAAKVVVGARPESGWWQLIETREGGEQVWEGSSSGEPHEGLLARGMIEEVVLDVEGVAEVNYRATRSGIEAYSAYVSHHGKLPDLRDSSTCVNNRYKKGKK